MLLPLVLFLLATTTMTMMGLYQSKNTSTSLCFGTKDNLEVVAWLTDDRAKKNDEPWQHPTPTVMTAKTK